MINKTFPLSKLIAACALTALMGTAAAANDVLAVARQKGNFTVLIRAIEAAGLEQTLSGAGPMTLFAPTDAAFAKLPAADLEALLKPENKARLVKILSYHVIAGKAIDQEALKVTRPAVTVEGDTVEFSLVRGRLRVDEARVQGDYVASNGLVHAVDRVLMPN